MEGLYRKELKALEDQYFRWRGNYECMYPHGMKASDGSIIPLDEILEKCVYQGLKSEIETLNRRYARTAGKTHHWIGINPPPKSSDPSSPYTLLYLYEKMRSAVGKYKMFEPASYMYSVEQNTGHGIRPHIHLFLENRTRPNRIIDTLAKHFNIPKHSIELKTYRNNTLWNEHIDYVTGNKKDSKLDNCEQDDLDRQEYDIPTYLGEVKKI